MTLKEQYFAFCDANPDVPLFMQAWWMSAVCAGKDWDVLLSYDEQGKIRAAMPYLLRKRLGMRFIVMPQQTQIGGIWLRQDCANDAHLRLAIASEFIAQMRALKIAYYYQQYPILSVMAEPMAQLGFKVKKRITYRLDDLHDMDSVVQNFSKNKKRQLQKALSLQVTMDLTDEEFYAFHRTCMTKQKKRITYSREFFLVIGHKTRERNQSQILAVRDLEGHVLAAAYLIWDNKALFYLIPCYDPDFKDSGASALLVLESIKLAKKLGVAFDFEGSMMRGVANHYKQFGSVPNTYYGIHKYFNPLFAILLFGNWLKNL